MLRNAIGLGRVTRKTAASVVFSLGLLGAAGVVWSAGLFQPGDSIAAYIHRPGAGSRVDVRADGTHDGAAWTTVFERSLLTGDAAHDIQFVPGGDYAFQVTTWDNSGGDVHDTSEAQNVYLMSIPLAPGPVVITPNVPAIFTALDGEYLASGEIRLRASWNDATKNDQRKRWIFDGTDWTQSSENEDRVAFIWDTQGDDFVTTGTCAGMCHPPDRMYTAAGIVDVWHWKATRTNPAGYADDKYWDDGAAGTASGRHSDSGQPPFSDNPAGSPPASMALGDAGVNAAFLFDRPVGTAETVPYTAGAWAAGDTLPGYTHAPGSGSRVDTRSIGTHDGTSWTTTFRRKLDTGDRESDLLMLVGNTYSFQVATFDNAGGIGHDVTEQDNIFTMMIPATPGPLVFSATPSILTSLTGNLLSSDEIEITATWPDATRNDVRKQWSYDGGAWTQSSENEDRISFIWDMEEDGFASAGTCALMCHPPNMYTAPGTLVDTWHWKASRTGPAGFTDDKFWDDGNLGTASGRHSDPGSKVYTDNQGPLLTPPFMSAAGPGNSARFLYSTAASAGWSRAVAFEDPILESPSEVKKLKMKLDFDRALKDSISISGTFDTATPPDLAAGPTGTLEVGDFAQGFTMAANGKSVKNANIKVVMKLKSGKWAVSVKKSDIRAGLMAATGGLPQDLNWRLTLENGWRISGTVSLLGSVNVGYGPKGNRKMRLRYRRKR